MGASAVSQRGSASGSTSARIAPQRHQRIALRLPADQQLLDHAQGHEPFHLGAQAEHRARRRSRP